jgi:MFS transporter, DHA3 family, macrolide efflux protein
MTAPRSTGAFYRLLLGGSIAQLGLDLTQFALAVTVIERSGATMPFGLLLVFTAVGDLSAYPFAGVLADRHRRRAVVLGKGLQLPLITAIALVAPIDGTIWALYALMVGRKMMEQLYQTSLSSAMGSVVPVKQLARADALQKLLAGMSRVIAPLLGSLLLGDIGARGLILCDTAACAVAVIVLSTAAIPAAAAHDRPELGTVQEMRRGWRYIADRPGLRWLLVLFAATSFTYGMVETLFPPLILRFSTPAALATMMSASGVGLLLGAGAMAIWGGPRRRAPFGLAVNALRGLVLGLAILPLRNETAVAAAFLFMLLVPFAESCTGALWQSKVPAAMRGRVYAVQHLIGWPLYPIACAIAGVLADRVFEPAFGRGTTGGGLLGWGPGHGIGLLLAAVGGLLAVVSLLGWLHPRLRRIDLELPDVELGRPSAGG